MSDKKTDIETFIKYFPIKYNPFDPQSFSPMQIAETRLKINCKKILVSVTPRTTELAETEFRIYKHCSVGKSEIPFTGERIPLYMESTIKAACEKINNGEKIAIIKPRMPGTRFLLKNMERSLWKVKN